MILYTKSQSHYQKKFLKNIYLYLFETLSLTVEDIHPTVHFLLQVSKTSLDSIGEKRPENSLFWKGLINNPCGRSLTFIHCGTTL